MARFLAHLCFFFSGFAALLYQVGWVKQLSVLMGTTSYTLTTILLSFMTGLAMGSFFVRFTKASQFLALPAYILIEILIGCYGISFLYLFQKIQGFYQILFLDQQFTFATEIITQFLLCGLLIFFPTFLMGATLPILSEFLYRKDSSFTEDFGRLYAVNSYGAFFGTIVCGYFLLPSFGYQTTAILAASINFFVAFLAWILKRLPTKEPTIVVSQETSSEEEDDDAVQLPFLMVCVLLFVSGFMSMSLQIAWNRLLGITLGASTYTFTMITACIILGIALGSHLITYIAARHPLSENHTILLVLLASITSFFVSYLMTYFPIMIGTLNEVLNVYFKPAEITTQGVFWKFVLSEIGKFIAILITLLPATCLLGGIFPLATALYNTKKATVRQKVGFAYFINMLGVILGSALTGYLWLSTSGFERTLQYNLIVAFIAAYILIHLSPGIPSLLQKWLYSLGLLYGLFLILWCIPLYNYHLITSSYFYNRTGLPSKKELLFRGDSGYGDYLKQKHKMIFLEEDAVGLITVHEATDTHARWFKVNGKVDGSTSNASKGGDIADCEIIATAGFLFEPDSRKVLTIGLGLGITHGTVLRFPMVEATVIEISEAVTHLSKEFFEEFNHRYWEKPNSKVHVQDGRQFLKLNSKLWDIIICEPSNPWMSGVSSLFTVEFYQLVRQRLKPEGVAILWFHTYGLEDNCVRSVLKSMYTVFPNCLMLQGPGDSDIYMIVRNGEKSLKVSEAPLKTFYPDQYKEILKIYHAEDMRDLLSKFVFMDQIQFGKFH
ncbi:MAG: fused MFS/spermidine synthase [Planctomycetota bacterium]